MEGIENNWFKLGVEFRTYCGKWKVAVHTAVLIVGQVTSDIFKEQVNIMFEAYPKRFEYIKVFFISWQAIR